MGLCCLCTQRLQHGIGHGAMVERAQQPASAVHLQVTSGPYRRRAHIRSEYGILGRQLADQPHQVLWVYRLASSRRLCQLVQPRTRLVVVRQRMIQECRV